MRANAEQLVGYYKLSEGRSGEARYPLPWLIKFAEWRRLDRPERLARPFRAAPMGRQDVPHALPLRPTAAEALGVIECWKFARMHQLCEMVWGSEEAREAARAQLSDFTTEDALKASLFVPNTVGGTILARKLKADVGTVKQALADMLDRYDGLHR